MMLILEPLIPGLRRYARALVRDAAIADDLVQDCLERAIVRWHQRRPERSARAWLYAILHNAAIDRGRRMARQGRHVAIEDTDQADLAAPPTQECGLHTGDVLAAIDLLPGDQRAVLLLVGVEDLSYAEAAEVAGVPIGTVMSRLSRGRDQLRALLDSKSTRPTLRRVK
ncbi:sigma-70 family RNA polymerase sigma factor [Novosphingobium sp. Fuku2-ISO-50]|uniref:sigma-70 family RNA polymerase sigma factor n=1 Tax=Novosphingobium sp. Fuku2-ISO-50 TaxID=1739114 RepID=UPI001E60D8E0|nr:sigma-70 family RNA polymerase sigma factor [Novosphingobium sp. Fuku2-ISO-50]